MFRIFKSSNNEEVTNLPYFTDLHSHLLPGVDDGSESVEESVELISYLEKWGIKKIITTPHIAEETFENSRETLENPYRSLVTELGKNGNNIEICYSAEYRLDDSFEKKMAVKDLIPFSDNHILIENSFLQSYWNLKDVIFKLQLAGYQPIFAHPERYKYYHSTPEIYDEIHNMGCSFQLNILSFSGHYGKTVKEISFHLLKKGYVDFMGTDMHHIEHAHAIESFLKSKEYAKLVPQFKLKNDTL